MREIKNINIVLLFESNGIGVQKVGSRHKCLCPFHSEKTPSMVLYPNNTFYCFGCLRGGDAVTFLMKYHGIKFVEALRYLGLESGRIDTAKIQRQKKRRQLVSEFHDWCRRADTVLARGILVIDRILESVQTMDELNELAFLYDRRAKYSYWRDIFCSTNDESKYRLQKEQPWIPDLFIQPSWG